MRYGLKHCGRCRYNFTVRIGTLFESSKVPMTKWLQATFLMCASDRRVSGQQLHRTLEMNYKTGWFLAHRIRAAMRSQEGAMLRGAKTIRTTGEPWKQAQGEAGNPQQQRCADQSDRLQADKFRDFGRQLECDEDEKAFEEKVRKLAKAAAPKTDAVPKKAVRL